MRNLMGCDEITGRCHQIGLAAMLLGGCHLVEHWNRWYPYVRIKIPAVPTGAVVSDSET